MNEEFCCSDDLFRLETAEWAAGLALEQAETEEEIWRLRRFRLLIQVEIDQFYEENWDGIVYWLETAGFDPGNVDSE